MSLYRVALVVGGFVALGGAVPGLAQDEAAVNGRGETYAERPTELADDTSAWRVDAVAYLWAISLDGDAAAAGNGFGVDAPFSDTLDNADSLIGLMGHVEVGRDQWNVFFSPTYSVVGYDDVATDSGPADVEVVTSWYEFGGAWRLGDGAVGGDADRRWTLDALGGARLTYLDLDVDLDAGGGGDADQTWVEPFIGARASYDLADRLTLRARGDVGGFGVGSDFAWQALAVLGWEFELFGNDAALFGGYRALGQDYDDGGFAWDVIAHGPMLGLQMRF